MEGPTTIAELLSTGADERVAIAGIDRPPLRYRDLRVLAADTQRALNGFGIGRNDRVAIVLPNGPEMATAFVTMACAATTAPLNPAYRQEEFDFYLSDLGARALVVEKGSRSPAVAAANARGIEVLELVSDVALPAGWFTLERAASTAASVAYVQKYWSNLTVVVREREETA